MTAKIILNPYSNRWNAQKRWPEAEATLKEAGVDFELAVSEHPRHVTELAEQAARQGFSPIIAAGGDGTIGETVNGLARAAKNEKALLGPFGVLPLGSANDLVDNLGLPKDLAGAAKVIAAGKTRLMDVGSVNGLYFANNSAIGLEPYITLVQQRITWIKGMMRYLVAAVMGIMDKPLWSAKIEWDGGAYQGPIILVTVGNGPRTGGVFFMTPHADMFDGRLSFVYAYRPTRRAMFAVLPKTMKAGEGSYVETADVHEVHTTWIKIHVDRPTPAHVDGEIFSEAIQDLEYRICPKRLQILMPE
ncbi:MAG TPA: diacylglycerol kinase family protein [Anaerolineales bacterium]|nr:diacylglycerol kinase family protein [Anaerolineales bacterium]